MRRLPAYAGLVAAVALLGAGCNGTTDSTSGPTASASTSGSATDGGSEFPTPTGTSTPEPTDGLLDWTPVRGSTDDTVTVAGAWTLTVSGDGARAALDGPRPLELRAGTGRRINDAFLDGSHALVVAQDRRESRPSVATVVDLQTGATSTIDGSSTAPTTSGGTWALGPEQAYYATVGGPGDPRAYCLAAADLGTGDAHVVWCAPKRSGFSNARVGAAGALSLLTFDDSRPSCRTVVSMAGVTVDGPAPQPYSGPTDCTGWEGVTLDDAEVWTEVPNENRIEQARAYASGPDGVADLGATTSGSLVACGEAAYFTRDAGSGRPAQVLRWSVDGGLQVVYRAAKAEDGFIATPLRCGGDQLTITSLSTAGDEQVTAPLV
jgi:hypothetical protein